MGRFMGVSTASLAKMILREHQENIRNSSGPLVPRPVDNSNKLHSSKGSHTQTAAVCVGARPKEAAQPATKQFSIKIAHINDPSQEITICISSDKLVSDLKEAISVLTG